MNGKYHFYRRLGWYYHPAIGWTAWDLYQKGGTADVIGEVTFSLPSGST
jgi:hypothetical protein